jgi:hypothetical protein
MARPFLRNGPQNTLTQVVDLSQLRMFRGPLIIALQRQHM